MTAHAMKGDREKCLEVGMNDCVSKPVTPAALKEILRKFLDVGAESRGRAPLSKPESKPPVQLSRIRDCAEGDLAFERELIEAFLSDTEQRLCYLEEAIRKEDWAQVEHQAHATKGSSANTGASGMQQIASQLVELSTNGELAPALQLLTDLRTEFDEVSRFLDAYSHSQEDGDPEHP